MRKIKRLAAALTIAAAATAGIVVPQVAAPQTASAASSCKKVIVGYTKPSSNPICWFTPSNPSCFAQPIYAARCGGKF